MAPLCIVEPYEETFVLLSVPKITVGRGSNKEVGWELNGDTIAFPHQRLSKRHITMAIGERVTLKNHGRNKINILIRMTDENNQCKQEQRSLATDECWEDVPLPCIISLYFYATKETYGTYYCACSLLPRHDILQTGPLAEEASACYQEVNRLISAACTTVDLTWEQQETFHSILGRYGQMHLVMVETVDCLDPQILNAMLDKKYKVVSLEPYHALLKQVLNSMREHDSLNGLILSPNPRIYDFTTPPCHQGHLDALLKARCPVSQGTPVDSESSLELALKGAALVHIDTYLDTLFTVEEYMFKDRLGVVGTVQCRPTGSDPYTKNGHLALDIDIGCLRAHCSRSSYLIMVYPDDMPSDWVRTLLDPVAERNKLYSLLRGAVGPDGPIYFMTLHQFAGLLYYRMKGYLEHFRCRIGAQESYSDIPSYATSPKTVSAHPLQEPPIHIHRPPEPVSVIDILGSSDDDSKDADEDSSDMNIVSID